MAVKQRYILSLDPALVAQVKFVHETDSLEAYIERLMKKDVGDCEVQTQVKLSNIDRLLRYFKRSLGLGSV